MLLRTLSLLGFRNLEDRDLHFPPEGVAVVGDNAQGKSNLLEAIHYLETFRSFRGAGDEALVNFQADVFRISATLKPADGGSHLQLSAAYRRSDATKRVQLDGVEAPRLSHAIGAVGSVLLTPGDVALVNEGPAERRRFLDILLSLNRPGYLQALQRYRKALGQRNAALRTEPGGAGAHAFDPILLETGDEIIRARGEWIEEQRGAFREVYGHVASREEADIGYRPSTEAGEGFRRALAASGPRERRMGTTVVGPHRDEVGLTVLRGDRWLELREFGSGGQRRTAALALRMAEARTVRKRRGRDPLLLLDDVFAELDPGRAARILEWMEVQEPGQVILTAPDDSKVQLRGGGLPHWTIRRGRIEEGIGEDVASETGGRRLEGRPGAGGTQGDPGAPGRPGGVE